MKDGKYFLFLSVIRYPSLPSMVLILDDNSNFVAHGWRKIGVFWERKMPTLDLN